jgi:hypothetical protein
MILKLEEIALNAWPAIEEFNLDGWVIRYANGVTKRSNSVNPLYESSEDIEEKIDFCESFYRSKAIPVCFKITEISKPKGLDQILEARGYEHKFDVLIQVMDISKLNGDIDEKIHLLENTDDLWLDHYLCKLKYYVNSILPQVFKQSVLAIFHPALYISSLHNNHIWSIKSLNNNHYGSKALI